MLLEYVETDLNLQVIAALVLGLLFGSAAQASRFCLRRAIASGAAGDRSAGAVWLMALGVAVSGFEILGAAGLVDVADHRHMSSNIAAPAILLGGLMFGAGMVLTRGCVSRLTVLSATGNLRAVLVLTVFALVAHATMKGVLAPLRAALTGYTVDLPFGSLVALPGAATAVSLALLGAAVFFAVQSRTRVWHLAAGALIGLVAVAGWSATSVLLMDEFDPTPVQSVAFTQPWADTLFWVIASTAVPAGFGAGFVGGVLTGSFLSASVRGELEWQGFEGAPEMLRYGSGGALMGIGGVLAGGCTVGAGLGGTAMLSIAAILTLISVILGAIVMRQILEHRGGQRSLA